MNFVNLFQQVSLPTKQVSEFVSKTGENCQLLDERVLDNIRQLGLVVSNIVRHFRVDYWMCATELFAFHVSIVNCKASLRVTMHSSRQRSPNLGFLPKTYHQ